MTDKGFWASKRYKKNATKNVVCLFQISLTTHLYIFNQRLPDEMLQLGHALFVACPNGLGARHAAMPAGK